MARTFISLRRKRGISLLEIMVSIGVLSVGLLGILALMPAASNQAKIGAQQDAAAILARRAFREMNVRWYGNPPLNDNFYCVDPVGQLTDGNLWFLGGLASANRLQMPPLVTVAGPDFGKTTNAGLNYQADQIFRTKDDLFFGEFASRENPAPNPPQQVALKNNATPPVAVKRFASGNLSWFATVVRKTTGFNTVSVAIVNKRVGASDLVFPGASVVDNTVPANPPNLIVAMTGGLGEIRLLKSATSDAWSNVKAGQWIMLASADTTTASTAPPFDTTVGTAEWYRVRGSGDVIERVNGNPVEYRALTVEGPNWTEPIDDPANSDLKTFAILIPNVIAVHSRNLPATQ